MHVAPHRNLGFSTAFVQGNTDPEATMAELDSMLPVLAAMEDYKTSASSLGEPARARDELEVTFLGTGSAVPSKYRSVTCILLDLFEDGCILLDGGEGSFAQFVRHVGVANVDDELLRLKLFWVSHMHADHHTGLLKFLAERRRVVLARGLPLQENLPMVMGPAEVHHYLREVEIAGGPVGFHFIPNLETQSPGHSHSRFFRDTLGLTLFQSIPVIHCRGTDACLHFGPSERLALRLFWGHAAL